MTRPNPYPSAPREVAGFPRLAALRREARLPVALCAARCGMSESAYRRFEAGGAGDCGRRDTFGLLLALAPLLAGRLGHPVSAQWDLCGAAPPPPPRDHAGGVADPTGKSGAGESVRAGDAPRRLHPTLPGEPSPGDRTAANAAEIGAKRGETARKGGYQGGGNASHDGVGRRRGGGGRGALSPGAAAQQGSAAAG